MGETDDATRGRERSGRGGAATESRWPASDRPMGIGVILPIAEDSAFGGTPHFADILAMTRTAEDAGFDAVWIIDHLVFRAQPDSQFQVPADEEDRGVWECFTTMAGLASATERIQIGSLVACTGFRNPGLVAKMTETIDDISGGSGHPRSRRGVARARVRRVRLSLRSPCQPLRGGGGDHPAAATRGTR